MNNNSNFYDVHNIWFSSNPEKIWHYQIYVSGYITGKF